MHDLTAEEAAEIFDELNQYKRFEMFVHPESRYLTEFHRRFYANIDGDIPHPPTEPVPSTSCYVHEEETWPNPEVGAVQPATNEQQSFAALCDQFHSNWQSFQSLQSFQSMQTFQSLHQSFHQTMQTAFRSHFKAWHELFPPENENEVTLEHKPTPWSPFQWGQYFQKVSTNAEVLNLRLFLRIGSSLKFSWSYYESIAIDPNIYDANSALFLVEKIPCSRLMSHSYDIILQPAQ